MSSLIQRYIFEEKYNQGRGVVGVWNGVWVKFDDVKEFLPPTSYIDAEQETNCRTCNSPSAMVEGSRCNECIQFSQWRLTDCGR